MPEDTVRQFVEQHAVPWPCGYGARETIGRFGALNRTSKIPGYETMPTLFLIGADGTVCWCDGHARTSHGEPSVQLRNLDDQIARALADRKSQAAP